MDKFRLIVPVNGTGYGIVGLSLIRALHEKGVEFELLPIGNIDVTEEFTKKSPFYESLAYSLDKRTATKEKLNQFIFWHIPQAFTYLDKDKKNVLYSTFETYPVQHLCVFDTPLENTLFSTTNKSALNLLKQYHNCNIYPTPIPHGFWFSNNRSMFKGNEIESVLENKSRDDINIYWRNITNLDFSTVLSICGKAEERKSTMETLTAFTLSFRKDPRNHLLLTASHNPFYPRKLDDILSSLQYSFYKSFSIGSLYKRQNKYILVFDRIQTRTELYHLLTNSHSFLSFSKGEGWNLPLTDMISLGVPCIIGHIPCYNDWIDEVNPVTKLPFPKCMPAKDELFFNGTCSWFTTDNLSLDILNTLDSINFDTVNKERRFLNYFDWDKAVSILLNSIKN